MLVGVIITEWQSSMRHHDLFTDQPSDFPSLSLPVMFTHFTNPLFAFATALRCSACCCGSCVGRISSTHSTSCGRITTSRPSTTSPRWCSGWPWWETLIKKSHFWISLGLKKTTMTQYENVCVELYKQFYIYKYRLMHITHRWHVIWEMKGSWRQRWRHCCFHCFLCKQIGCWIQLRNDGRLLFTQVRLVTWAVILHLMLRR